MLRCRSNVVPIMLFANTARCGLRSIARGLLSMRAGQSGEPNGLRRGQDWSITLTQVNSLFLGRSTRRNDGCLRRGTPLDSKQLHPSFLTTNVSNKSGNLLFAQS